MTRSATYTLTVNGTGGGCTAPGQKLGNPGFESGNTAWTASSGVIAAHSSQPARTGTYKRLAERVRPHPHRDARPVGEPAGRLPVVRTSASGCTSTRPRPPPASPYDKLKVQVLNSSGTVLATLATYSNLNKATGYSQKSFSLAAYAGQTVSAEVHRHRGLLAPDVLRRRRHRGQRLLT